MESFEDLEARSISKGEGKTVSVRTPIAQREINSEPVDDIPQRDQPKVPAWSSTRIHLPPGWLSERRRIRNENRD